MRYIQLVLVFLISFQSCLNSDNEVDVVFDNDNSILEHKKVLVHKSEANNYIKSDSCAFDNPDTSLSNIKLRDIKSAFKVLNGKQLKGDTTYNFKSRDNKQVLSVTVHPGDYKSQVSIFQIKYAKNVNIKAEQLSIDNFATEKQIKLGSTKKEILEKLGPCYSTTDSTANNITIHYNLTSPEDSQTQLLKRHAIPMYYATYRFQKEKLIDLEFGFGYP